jgi:acetyl esterase/lipase
LNGDGLVGVTDVLAMLNDFGMPCPGVSPIPQVTSDSAYAVVVEPGIVYAEGLSHDTLNSLAATSMPLLLDAYVPQGAGANRPALVLIHGGGFFGGSRAAWSMVNLAQHFAGRGWVVFSIDYRLASDFGTVPQAWVDSLAGLAIDSGSMAQSLAIYPAHRDAKAALRWVISHADEYDINTDYLTVGGGSAGAIVSIGVGVTEPEDFTSELTVAEDPSLLSAHLGVDFEVATILDFWGSSISVSILEATYGLERFDASDPPLCIIHGTEDSTVPFLNALVLQAKYEDVGVPYVLHALDGAGHGPWGANLEGESLAALAFNFIVAQQALIIE